MAVGGKYLLRCKFHRDVSSGTNEAGGTVELRMGSGRPLGRILDQVEKIIEKRIQVYDICMKLGRILTVCVCRTRIVDSQARRMTHSTREFPRGPRLLDFSSHLGTNFSAFLFHACAQFEHVTRVRYRCFLARRTRTISLGRYPSSLITNWISRTRKSIVSRDFKWTTFRRWSNCACKFKEIFKSSNRFDLLSSPNLVWNFWRLWKCVHNFLKKICIAHE